MAEGERGRRRETERCPTCNARRVEYRHVMNRALVLGLMRLDAVGGTANLADLGLTRNQWDNFQKLRYWDLVQQVAVDGVRKKGVWEVTPLGAAFLRGTVTIAHAVFTYRGERTEFSGPMIGVRSLHPESYRKREDYARDRRVPDQFRLLP